MVYYTTYSQAFILWALVLRTACAGDSARSADAATSGELDRCALLKTDEIERVIGTHGPGSSDLSNMWGTRSCRWTATRAQKVEGMPEWHDAIEVAVFEATEVPMVRQQVKGDPVADVAPGATYDESYGDVWFDCAGGRLCAVKVRTASG